MAADGECIVCVVRGPEAVMPGGKWRGGVEEERKGREDEGTVCLAHAGRHAGRNSAASHNGIGGYINERGHALHPSHSFPNCQKP